MGDFGIVFDRTIQLMQDRLQLSSVNQKVVSGNLANINTPGYKAKAMAFEDVLRESMEDPGARLVQSNLKHINPADTIGAMKAAEVVESGPVDLDTEMMKLSRNSIEYQFMISMLNKKFTMIKNAISEGGQA
ncbi:MAG: flagellar basal body rod protein FlgB [Syntrophobacteraceae bacterium]